MFIHVIETYSVFYGTHMYCYYHNSLWFVRILTNINAVFIHPFCFFITGCNTFSLFTSNSSLCRLSMLFLQQTYRTSVPCLLILLAFTGGHICLAFNPAERNAEPYENVIVIVIVIVWRSCANILKFIRCSITPRSSRMIEACLLAVDQEQY
jgi:hypothetical protein